MLAVRDVGSDRLQDHDRGKKRALIADGLFITAAAAIIAAWYLNKRAKPAATIDRSHAPQ